MPKDLGRRNGKLFQMTAYSLPTERRSKSRTVRQTGTWHIHIIIIIWPIIIPWLVSLLSLLYVYDCVWVVGCALFFCFVLNVQSMVSNVYSHSCAVNMTFQSMVLYLFLHSHHLAYVCSDEGSTKFSPGHSILVVKAPHLKFSWMKEGILEGHGFLWFIEDEN